MALAILAPVLIFIATATRLSAARREQRFAAMRLVGATRRQVSWLAATESTVAGVAGVAAGFGIFFLLRIPVAGIPFIGQPFFPAELSLSPPDILAVAIGVPVAAAVAARLALRRVRISPLGVARRATPPPPRAWQMLPLLAGFAELGFFTVHGKPASPAGQDLAFVPGFALIIVGLVLAGPWLTMATARVMARRTSRPGTLIAARRLADDPRAAFRAVSGLVLALFITTVAVVGITTWNAQQHNVRVSAAETKVLTDQLAGQQARPAPGPAAPAAPLAAELQRDSRRPGGGRGPRGPGADHPRGIPPPRRQSRHRSGSGRRGLVRAARGRSRPGPLPGRGDSGGVPGRRVRRAPVRRGRHRDHLASRERPGHTAGQPRGGRHQRGDERHRASGRTGQDGAGERTRLSAAYLGDGVPSTVGELIAQSNPTNSGYQQLANTVILVSLPIAGCTLAAGIAAGLADRKRPFSLLRLTGARLATLRRVVALEGAVPLLAVAAVAIGTGFGAAAMYASLEMQHPMVAPGAAYYLLTAGGILAALGIIAATFPLLARITGPEVARNE